VAAETAKTAFATSCEAVQSNQWGEKKPLFPLLRFMAGMYWQMDDTRFAMDHHNLSFTQSFTEIDPHEVKWVPVNGVPRLYMNRALSAGLRHRLPPSVVLEAHMSISYVVNRKSTFRDRFCTCMSSCRIHGQLPSCHRKLYSFRRGSLGKPKYLSEDLETDPMRAHYELGVNMAPLPGSSLWVCPCPATP
jgi:hypothetical protein